MIVIGTAESDATQGQRSRRGVPQNRTVHSILYATKVCAGEVRFDLFVARPPPTPRFYALLAESRDVRVRHQAAIVQYVVQLLPGGLLGSSRHL
jgi:hypothetical protein